MGNPLPFSNQKNLSWRRFTRTHVNKKPTNSPADAIRRTLIAPRTYVDQHGRFWSRPTINRRRTWRMIVDGAGNPVKRKAVAVAQSLNTDWRPNSENFSSLVELYVQAGCITRKQKWKRGSDDFVSEETTRANKLAQYFGKLPVSEVNDLFQLQAYAKWRLKQFEKGKGTRAVDKEGQTLSNVINYAVCITKQERLNYVRENRATYHTVKSRSRQRMPVSADIIHHIADYFFTASQNDGRALRSEVFGWMTLFQMFTGCRTSELLRLRKDAATVDDPGFIQGEHLFLARSKGGINPWASISPEFAAMLPCFWRWHQDRFPKAKVFFPGPMGKVVDATAHVHAMKNATTKLGLPHLTPHGLRSYYVTKRRRDGILDSHIAAEIGDTTVALISSTYGAHPGGAKLSWLPSQGLPAWSLWQPAATKIARIA